MKPVSVERHIDQVVDGSKYKGYVQIGKAKLDYELDFAVSIPETDTMPEPKDQAEARRIFQITVKKDGSDIPLTDQEWGFFFSMLVMFAAEFYHLPQTRDSNSGTMGKLMNGTHSFLSHMASVSIGMTSKSSFNFSPDLRTMLNTPKFDCKLAA